MHGFIISDKEFQTERFERLHHLVKGFLAEKSLEITETQITRGDLAHCTGCFGCWIKRPGECVIRDGMAEINHRYVNTDVIVYLSPVVFGQFSANIKNALDRWLPNMLPFFEKRPDGSTMHPARYIAYPLTIIIGYGDELTKEDSDLFVDITAKHRRNVEVLIYQGNDAEISHILNQVELKKVGAQL